MSSPARSLVLCLALMSAWACQERNKGPEVASSAGDASFAEGYPDSLNATSERHELESSAVVDISGKLPEYPATLDEPDWGVVLDVYERADAEGGSSAYVAHQREEAVLGRFYQQERKLLVRRIAASNEYVAKEKGCTVELWGATDRGLEKALEERLEERRRSDSEAHAIVTREEESIGKKNQEALRDQIDEIRFASYVVRVGLVTEEEDLRRGLADASQARSTLEAHVEELKAREKPDAEAIARAQKALASLDPAVARAEERLKEAEQRRKDLAQRYEDALSKLTSSVEQKRDAQADAKR